jgi:hypothetical protein
MVETVVSISLDNRVITLPVPSSKMRGTGARITASRAVLRRSMLKRLVAVLIKKRLSARPMVSMIKAIAKMIIAKLTASFPEPKIVLLPPEMRSTIEPITVAPIFIAAAAVIIEARVKMTW